MFITLKSILVVDLLGLDKLTTAYGILSLLEGVGSLAGTPLLGTQSSIHVQLIVRLLNDTAKAPDARRGLDKLVVYTKS